MDFTDFSAMLNLVNTYLMQLFICNLLFALKINLRRITRKIWYVLSLFTYYLALYQISSLIFYIRRKRMGR